MKEKLVSAINEIHNDRSIIVSDEASIKSGVVLRLISLLGWNPFDVNEVKPEYTVESKRVDFSLRINGTNKVFIEVKRPNEDLEAHQEQLLGYSFREGVKLAILTNGITWWFYLPLNEGSWEQRRFFTADFLEQDQTAITEKLIELLSRDHVASGDAFKTAEHLYKSHQKKKIVWAALPKAWYKILNDPDDLFVDLLVETTEKLSGFRPEIEEVEKFIMSIQKTPIRKPEPSPTPKPPIAPGPIYPKPQPPTYPEGSYINKRIRSIQLLGNTYHPRTWKDIIVLVSEEMYRRHSAEFFCCLTLRGSRMSYFSQQPNEMSLPRQIAGSTFFVETKLNSNSIIKRCHELMGLFGYKEKDLYVSAE
ncbi:MAG TPA: restriction endonuclease subunit R [bacterium]|nr:restriction endonuclease subunit R [bacterium]